MLRLLLFLSTSVPRPGDQALQSDSSSNRQTPSSFVVINTIIVNSWCDVRMLCALWACCEDCILPVLALSRQITSC